MSCAAPLVLRFFVIVARCRIYSHIFQRNNKSSLSVWGCAGALIMLLIYARVSWSLIINQQTPRTLPQNPQKPQRDATAERKTYIVYTIYALCAQSDDHKHSITSNCCLLYGRVVVVGEYIHLASSDYRPTWSAYNMIAQCARARVQRSPQSQLYYNKHGRERASAVLMASSDQMRALYAAPSSASAQQEVAQQRSAAAKTKTMSTHRRAYSRLGSSTTKVEVIVTPCGARPRRYYAGRVVMLMASRVLRRWYMHWRCKLHNSARARRWWGGGGSRAAGRGRWMGIWWWCDDDYVCVLDSAMHISSVWFFVRARSHPLLGIYRGTMRGLMWPIRNI